MAHPRLSGMPYPAGSPLTVSGAIALQPGRVHEFCGPARRRLALKAAARSSGPVIWIRPAWQSDRLNPEGVCPIADPARLIFVDCRRGRDLLWCLEETLRAGAVAVAVAELPDPPGLTPVRRLTLAAETGAAATGRLSLALLLTPGSGGAAGVESRWQAVPAHAPDRMAWRISRLRARTAPPAAWVMDAADRMTPVTAASG